MKTTEHGIPLKTKCLPVKSLLILILTLTLFPAPAQNEVFPETFQRIAKLKPAEAEKEYALLAEKTAKPIQQDAAWVAAAEKAMESGRLAEADAYLRRIKDDQLRNLSSMKMLQKTRKWQELIALSGGFRLELWKENLIPEAALIRAQAYAIAGKKPEAEKDIALAMKSVTAPGQKGEMLLALSNLYSQYLKDPAKELELMRPEMGGLNGCSHNFQQKLFCRYAELLASQGQVAEAVKVLESYQPDSSPGRRHQVKATLAKLYLQQGDKAKSEALQKEAEQELSQGGRRKAASSDNHKKSQQK